MGCRVEGQGARSVTARRRYTSRPSPLVPALRVSASPDHSALLDFDFVDAALPWRSGCVWLGGARRETWLPDAAAVDEYLDAGVLQRRAGAWAMLGLHRPMGAGSDVAGAAQALYAQLIATARPSAHPYLIRIWNFLGAINAGEGDAERYRRFCVGRNAAVDAMFRDPPPAATAIGAPDAEAPLSVVALCSAQPAIALENPRQTPAWQYPREYGPVPPGFSRGAVLRDADGATLLASGTASIVGHVSLHAGDVVAQLDESLANLHVLLDEGSRRGGERFRMDGLQALRVYLRDSASLDAVQARLAAQGLPLDRIAFLHGDICRRELDVELEGVFSAR
jgi:chorismate lyase/3-hydroxybenzoate synthase